MGTTGGEKGGITPPDTWKMGTSGGEKGGITPPETLKMGTSRGDKGLCPAMTLLPSSILTWYQHRWAPEDCNLASIVSRNCFIDSRACRLLSMPRTPSNCNGALSRCGTTSNE
eukprot:1790623-Rhodomonas_salina.5